MKTFSWFRAGLTAGLLWAGTHACHAGQYFQDFSGSSVGATSFGDGSTLYSTSLGTVAAVQDATFKELALTASGTANVHSAFLLPDLDPGTPVLAFSAKWNSQVYGNFPNAADGFSFTFGPVAGLDLAGAPYAREEAGYNVGLCLSVQTAAGGTPGFFLKLDGTTIASQTYDPTTQWGVNNGTRHFFEVDWDIVTGLTVRVDGQAIFTNVVIAHAPQAGDRFVWAARCGALSEEVRLDNLVVVTGGNLVAASVGAPHFFTSEHPPTYPAANTFDGNPATAWVSTTASANVIGGTLAATQAVSVYVLNNGTLPGPAAGPIPAGAVPPALFQLEGSADGTSWTAFGSSTVRFFANQESRAFLVPGSTPFQKWQLNILLNGVANSAGFGTGLGELQLHAFQPAPYAAPTLTASAAASNVLSQIAFTANIDTHSLETTVVMEVGTTAAYGTSVSVVLPASAGGAADFTGAVPIAFDRTTALHGRIRVTNAAGTVTGPDLTFTSESFALRASRRLGNIFVAATDSAAWLDLDDDGALDLVAIGINPELSGEVVLVAGAINLWNPKTSGIANWPGGNLNVAAGLRGFVTSGDHNNDNIPDVALGGGDAGDFSVGNNGFTAIVCGTTPRSRFPRTGLSVPSSTGSAGDYDFARCVLRDFDHDGKQDMLLTGYQVLDLLYNVPGTGPFARLYRNVFAGTVSSANYILGTCAVPPMGHRGLFSYDLGAFSLSSGDVDGDGFPDVYAYADKLSPNDGKWTVYRNNHELDFDVLQSGPPPPGRLIWHGASSTWADFNGDGHDDVLVAESSYDVARTRILLNDGAGNLVDSGIVLPQWNISSVAAGDIFNHGRNDIVMSGHSLGDFVAHVQVLRNEGDGTFTPFEFGFYGMLSKSGQGIALSDYDNDGRLDITVVGGVPRTRFAPSQDSTSLYRNQLDIAANQPPAAPGGLSAAVGPGKVTFGWGNATDDITPANLLTYNLRVGTTPGGTDTVSPLANVTTGWRKIAAPGNCGHVFGTFYRFPPGTYYWSMQAVDGAFAGGAWATEGSFTVPAVPEAVADTVTRPAGRTLKVPFTTLLANDHAPAGPAVTVTAVDATSAGGVPVQWVGGILLYSPAASFNADDSFTYTISDGTHTATATVSVTVLAAPETPTQNIVSSVLTGGGVLEIKAAGIPGRSYRLQITGSLTSPVTWTNLGAVQVAPANGQMTFTDATPAAPGFYRVNQVTP